MAWQGVAHATCRRMAQKVLDRECSHPRHPSLASRAMPHPQLYAAGYLEGFLTAERIWDNFNNM